MIPFHSLPVGCVCNFLEYKSCIIHVYQRATSINYVSLLGACVFTASPSSFIPPLLSGTRLLEVAPSTEFFWLLWFCLVQKVKGTVSNSHREEDERKCWRKGKSLQWCCDVNALI